MGQAEAGNFHRTIRLHDDVAGPEVAVRRQSLMRIVECGAGLDSDRDRLVERQRSVPSEQAVEGLASDQFRYGKKRPSASAMPNARTMPG